MDLVAKSLVGAFVARRAAAISAFVGLLAAGGGSFAADTVAEADEPRGTVTPTGSYLSAHHAEFIGDSAAAAEFLGHVLAIDAGNATLQRRVFIHLVASGRINEALALAESVSASGQSKALATITRAIGAARKGDHEEAAAILDEPLTGNFAKVMVPLLKAWALQGTGDTEGAIALLTPLEEEEGLKLFGDFHTALILDLSDETEKAEAAYAKAMGDAELVSPRLVEAYVSFLARAGRVDEARALLDKSLAEDPNAMPLAVARSNLHAAAAANRFVATTNEGLAEALFEIAAELRRENARNVSLILAQLSIYLRPDFDIGHVLIAEVLDDHGQLEAAIESYNRVPDDSPIAGPVRVRRAELLGETGNLVEAVALLESLASERDDWPEPLIRLGHIMRGEERFEEAVSAYDRAAERIAEIDENHWALLYSRGIALERSDEWPRAEEDFLRALDFNPDQPYVLNYLGYSWVDQGVNLDRARSMIERAVELRPSDGYIVDSLGWALYRMGEFDGAVEQLEKAVELRPEDPVINDHLGDAYWQVGRKREARFQWRRALSLDPEDDEVGRIRAKLKDGLDVGKTAERDT